ncbi:UDP-GLYCOSYLTRANSFERASE 91A1-LIKE [Salix koriyanagi]|uniref:UDP-GLYCOSYLTRANSFERASE 91A1-LIKE n=1 Tax=Salix koriyanagi TaxID=2511006 RepID=A0A9Q0U3X3_9ROSI|nr:UDP-GLYCOSYLTRANSFERASE 91A1-LIKE [Salix koriyanagi]
MAEKLHVVMLPWIAFGHMIPFFQLSIALAKAGIKVSFVSTPRNIKRLPEIPPGLADLVEFVEFPLPSLENDVLPEDGEATVDIPAEKIDYLKIAYDLLKHPLKQFIADQLPDWIIIDMMPYWMVDIARENKVSLIHFTVLCAAACVFLGHPERIAGDDQKRLTESTHMTSKPEWVDFPSSVAYRNDEAVDAFEGIYGENASGITDVERVTRIHNGCQALVVRSCAEFEGDYLNLFERLIGKPVIPLGLMPREKQERKQFTDVEKGLGVEIEKGEDGSFTRDGVEKALKLAMVSVEGKSMREKASEAAALFGNLKLHQDFYIGKFVDFLKKKKRNV